MATVADILLAQGQRAGNARRQQGAQSAGMWTDLASIIGQTGNAIVREQQEAPIRKQQQVIRDAQVAGIQKGAADEKTLGSALQSPSRAKALKALEAQPELYDRAVKHYENIDNNMKRLLGSVAAGVREFGDSPEAALIGLGDLVDQGFDAQKLDQYRVHIIEHPESVSDIIDGLLKNSPDETHNRLVRPVAKPAEPFTLGEGQTRFGSDGQTIASVAKPVEAPKPDARPLNVQLSDAIKSGDMVAASAIRRAIREAADAGRAPEKATVGSLEQQIADALAIGDQAKVDRLTKAAELAAGARARTQGRPVTSGDAGDISELRSSLDDIKVLGDALGTTGAASKVGAMLPNVVTEMTGWGADAKSRQGVIDRVKQVIGKALEGGVLRKEDEIKYVKILPTIGDPPSVAASKLSGLKSAIEKKLQRKVESLSDAGYDVTKFGTAGKVYLDDNGEPKQGGQ